MSVLRPIATALLPVLFLPGCGQDDDHDHPQLTTGAALYDHHCRSCHGGSGDGAFLRGVPAVRYSEMSYRQIVDQILGHGRAQDSRMPRFPSMSKAEAEAIAVYLRQKLQTG